MGCGSTKEKRKEPTVRHNNQAASLNQELGQANMQAGWSNNQDASYAPKGHQDWGNRAAAPDVQAAPPGVPLNVPVGGQVPMQQAQYNYGQPQMAP